MTTKAARLQQALEVKARLPVPARASRRVEPTPDKTPSRAGKIQVNVWLSPDYKRSLRAVQMRHDRSLQALIEEALNDLFSKYDVPVISED